MDKSEFIEVGQIINTHGLKGEVKIRPWADSIETLLDLDRLFIDGKEVKIEAMKDIKGFAITKLEGINDVDAANMLRNKIMLASRSDIILPENRYFIVDIIGSDAIDETGNNIGKVVDVLERPASNIFVIEGETEHLVPAIPVFFKDFDKENKVITVHLIEGM